MKIFSKKNFHFARKKSDFSVNNFETKSVTKEKHYIINILNLYVMYKNLFSTVLDLVSELTGTSKEDILSGSHRAEVVDARCICVHSLFKAGMYPTVIASMMSKSSAGIRHLLSSYENRKTSNKLFSTISKEIEKKLESNLYVDI